MLTWQHKVLVLVVYIITFLIGMPANIVALYAFIKKVRQRATPVDVLLIGLTISDLLFLLFLPLRMKEAVDNMQWNMPYFLCPLSGLVFFGTIYNSTLYLTAISVERYLGVAFPIKYKRHRKPLYAVVGSVIIWAISLAQCRIIFIMQYYPSGNDTASTNTTNTTTTNTTSCYTEFSSDQLKILLPFRLHQCIFLFFAPLLICCFCYINFIRILIQLPNICPQRQHRAVGLALGTMLVFVVCFGPYNMSHLVGYVTGVSPTWRSTAVLISAFNACLDPFVYYFSSSVLRGTFSSILSRLSAGLQRCFRTSHGQQMPGAVEERTRSTNDNLG